MRTRVIAKKSTVQVIASAVVTHTREASFGRGRPAEWASAHTFGWDDTHDAFVRGDKGEVMTGCLSVERYPCDPTVAADILALCAETDVQKRFLANFYARADDVELYCCGETLVVFRLHKAAPGKGMGLARLASFSFGFYSPRGVVQHIYLSHQLCSSLANTLRGATPETIKKNFKVQPSATLY